MNRDELEALHAELRKELQFAESMARATKDGLERAMKLLAGSPLENKDKRVISYCRHDFLYGLSSQADSIARDLGVIIEQARKNLGTRLAKWDKTGPAEWDKKPWDRTEPAERNAPCQCTIWKP